MGVPAFKIRTISLSIWKNMGDFRCAVEKKHLPTRNHESRKVSVEDSFTTPLIEL